MTLPLPSLWGLPLKDVITSFTSGIVCPVIGLIFKAGFKDLKYILEIGSFNVFRIVVGGSDIMCDEFLIYTIDFFCCLCNVLEIKGIKKFKKEKSKEVATGPTNNALLCEIRDLLKK